MESHEVTCRLTFLKLANAEESWQLLAVARSKNPEIKIMELYYLIYNFIK